MLKAYYWVEPWKHLLEIITFFVYNLSNFVENFVRVVQWLITMRNWQVLERVILILFRWCWLNLWFFVVYKLYVLRNSLITVALYFPHRQRWRFLAFFFLFLTIVIIILKLWIIFWAWTWNVNSFCLLSLPFKGFFNQADFLYLIFKINLFLINLCVFFTDLIHFGID